MCSKAHLRPTSQAIGRVEVHFEIDARPPLRARGFVGSKTCKEEQMLLQNKDIFCKTF
jgi:hypothetical protein